MWGVHVTSLGNYPYGIIQTKNRRKTRVLNKEQEGFKYNKMTHYQLPIILCLGFFLKKIGIFWIYFKILKYYYAKFETKSLPKIFDFHIFLDIFKEIFYSFLKTIIIIFTSGFGDFLFIKFISNFFTYSHYIYIYLGINTPNIFKVNLT